MPLTVEEAIPGTRVQVIGAPHRTGNIAAAPAERAGVWTVRVTFDDGTTTTMRVANLESVPDATNPFEELKRGSFHGVAGLRRNILHEKLHGRLTNLLYSMETSKTDFYAYQFKPVFKLLDSPSNSLLIADEVGLGKTIEAGLIWTELRARSAARNLLVVCPPHLREEKWRMELLQKFGVKARVVNAKEFLHELSLWRQDRSHTMVLIASFEGLRPPKGWQNLDATEIAANTRAALAHELTRIGIAGEQPFDLLVMDEAHKMRNQATANSKLGDILLPAAAHRIFLSATPIHTSNKNLFTLLHLLDPDTYSEEFTFGTILEANEPLVRLRDRVLLGDANRIELLSDVNAALSNPLLRESSVLASIQDYLDKDEAPLSSSPRAELAAQVEKINLLSKTVTRTRKSDVLKNRVLREVKAVRVPLSELERGIYDEVSRIVLQYAAEHGIPSGFLRVMPQRQIASCMAAALAGWLNHGTDIEDDDELNPDVVQERPDTNIPVRPLIEYLRDHLAGHITVAELERTDGKYQLLVDTLREYWKLNPGNKVVLFSYFKPTLRYLKRRLAQDNVDTLVLMGGMGMSKGKVVEEFRKPTSPLLLLSSEIGSEGLDMEFASALVNYDLPWNPMVVEQRIGRLDRINQEAEKILIYNFFTEDTVDAVIYDRLYDRLELFKRTLGDLEDVIGPIISELTRDLLTHQLSAEQTEEKLKNAKRAIAVNLQLAEELEGQASVLAAYGDYIIQQIQKRHDRQGWIKANDVENYILDFLRQEFPKTQVQGIDPSACTYEIELDFDASYELRNFNERENLIGQTQLSTVARRIRFDHRTFTGTSGGEEVIGQGHPLVRFAGHHLRAHRRIAALCSAIKVALGKADGFSGGSYLFIVQRWTVTGLRVEERLRFSAMNAHTGEVLDEEQAETLIESTAAQGSDWPAAGVDLANGLSEIASALEKMNEESESAFWQFEQQCRAENQDRGRLQLLALERYEHRRLETLHGVLQGHRDMGRLPLAAATEAQIRLHQEVCETRRRKIQEQITTEGNCSTLCIGIVRVEQS